MAGLLSSLAGCLFRGFTASLFLGRCLPRRRRKTLLLGHQIVVALLDAGAGTETTDIMGNDPLIAACGIGRLDNVKTWFTKVKKWKVDRQNAKFGSTALHVAVYMGPKKLDLVKYLVRPFFSFSFSRFYINLSIKSTDT